ncbi:ApbE family lipoprotein [Chlorobaculum parvum NCIB 8327]|uniref:FAD:protein FMN transferase n=1 Tax=Chlorobaculum parvum (strain DSM 263 / NCIMB 8327) TaxID=517417 RepID=B3QNE4_CHLP8|nr:FAD:protein FMN transferase [Chlorobaculum parvum]ACF11447.1 ApbE family lipoprotein [Chlorobaculum parvum NCIB 8327]
MQRFEFRAMGSACEIVLAGVDKKESKILAALAMKDVARIERKFSRYQPESVISKINAQAGLGLTVCDEETSALIDYADAVYRSSGGLFDVTSGVLRKAWDFDRAEVPSQKMLFELLKLVGWEHVEREGSVVRLPEVGMQLDFGGIGKEYAADAAAELLNEQGVRHGYVNLGGDLRIIGPKPSGEPWTIGIRDPRKPGSMIASIPVSSGAIATSGDYERFFELAGQRYCHIINPKSGWPVSFWRSVTVLAPLATTAGSCATIAMLLEKQGVTYLKKSGFNYLAIDQNGKLYHNH